MNKFDVTKRDMANRIVLESIGPNHHLIDQMKQNDDGTFDVVLTVGGVQLDFDRFAEVIEKQLEEFIEGEALLYHLSDAGICASSGSACSSGSLEPSHVIRAMGVPFTAVHGSLRFSLSRYNTEEDINQVIQVMPGIVDKLRKISPFVNA
jgi:cysteine sulfinate desulfinase/cysteine desulfurase-like protein